MRITVEGVGGVKLASEQGYEKWLTRNQVKCLLDSDGDQVDFESLVDGGMYTLGPARCPPRQNYTFLPQQLPEQQEEQRLEKLLQTAEFDPSTIHQYDEFKYDGFGPFVVKRESLMHRIIQEANPHKSVHISGCKGAGKTNLLNLIGAHLVNICKEEVYFFRAAARLNNEDWTAVVTKLIREKRKAYILVDETQTAAASIPEALVQLLKNDRGHLLTVIGAGVPEFRTMSANFVVKRTTHELFLSKEALREEGIVHYFDSTPKGIAILEHIRDHCGGHIYPLMRGMELLKRLSNYESLTSEQVIAFYESPDFRRSPEYKDVCSRVLPQVFPEEIRPLFYSTRQIGALDALRKKGFVSETGKVLSSLLLDAYVASLYTPDKPITNLSGGLDGIVQVLRHSLPGVQWSQYTPHGGPVEDALSFELLTAMSHIPQLTTRLFNPKLVDVGTSGRRPDIYINSLVNSYVECLLTEGHTDTDQVSLDEHIDRFCAQKDDSEVRYRLLDTQDFAVLNFQKTGTIPLNPSDEFSTLFEERVFTFLMATRKIYRGNTPLDG